MFKPIFIALLSFLLPFSNISYNLFNGTSTKDSKAKIVTLEKMIVANGNIAMNIDLSKLNGTQRSSIGRSMKRTNSSVLQFDVQADSFFTVMVYDKELRGSMPSSMNINPKSSAALPPKLDISYNNLLIEQMPFGEHYEFAVRDRKTGFTFFNIEGHLFNYDSTDRAFNVSNGRLVVSKEFAQEMRRPELGGTVIGNIEINTTLRPIEVTELVDGKVESNVLPAKTGKPANVGSRPGPDVVVGDVFGLSQFGSSGSRVGLALGTTSCNYGEEDLSWFRLPDNDHPVIPQNLYRMSSDGSRFEQIGQSQVKHAFTALTQNLCGLGCNGTGGTRLGSGCSDPYSAGLNAGPNLGSKAWINPFTGAYPRGDSGTSPNTHGGHSHNGTSHRILTESNDLNSQMNVGARYFAEGQYVTPHEYDWCQSNPGECNMNNNTSYREYSVTGTSSFGFSPTGSTVREKSAINAWQGATFVEIQPDGDNDGIATLGYKVTEISTGLWHYEYAIHNQNLDRAIQSLSVAVPGSVSVSDIGFYAPPQHPGTANDGTNNNEGFSETAWFQSSAANAVTWSSETLSENQNANAIRWGSMYNFRFTSTSPPETVNATIGFYKTGSPMVVQVQGPAGEAVSTASISGRVTADGRGVGYAAVGVSGTGFGASSTVWTYTNQFGYYSVPGIQTGQTYSVSVAAKKYSFTTRQVELNGNLSGVNFESE